MSNRSDVYEDFEDDDDFFMNDISEDERDRSNSLVFIEAESTEPKALNQKEESVSSPALSQESVSERDQDDSTSESDDEIVIISESTTAPAPADPELPTKRRLRSQTTKSSSDKGHISVNKRPIPLLPTTRSKRQKQSEPANERVTKATSNKTSGSRSIENYEAKIPQKLYNVKLLSRLDGAMGKVVHVPVLGRDEFKSILQSVLDGTVKDFDLFNNLEKRYTVDDVTLYWNNAKLLKFMTCDSLRIERASEDEIAQVEITMVPQEREQEHEDRLRSNLMRLETASRSVSYDNSVEVKESESLEYQETDKTIDRSDDSKDLIPVDHNNEPNYGAIKIALVGQDNKRLYVQVRPSTTFFKVAEYYKLHKPLPANAQIKLIFDHEELDLSGTIAEQDMENDDMIEVLF